MRKLTLQTRLFAFSAVALIIATSFYAFKPEVPDNEGKKKYLMVTTVESMVPMGLGRSRMFVTDQNGNLMVEDKMKNFYSGVGINFGNINQNDAMVIKKVNELMDGGWTLDEVVTAVQSPSAKPKGGMTDGIFLSRYMFSKTM